MSFDLLKYFWRSYQLVLAKRESISSNFMSILSYDQANYRSADFNRVVWQMFVTVHCPFVDLLGWQTNVRVICAPKLFNSPRTKLSKSGVSVAPVWSWNSKCPRRVLLNCCTPRISRAQITGSGDMDSKHKFCRFQIRTKRTRKEPNW